MVVSDEPIIPVKTIKLLKVKIKKPVKLELIMNDKIREEFERTWISVIGSWNPSLHFTGDKYYPIEASYDPHMGDELNRAWFVFKDLYKSRDPEFKEATEKIFELDGLVDMLEREKKDLHKSCNEYKKMYVEKMAENKKLRELLEHFENQIMCHAGSCSKCMYIGARIREALKDDE